MRTLSGTLSAAQKGTLLNPYVRVTRRRMSSWEDRFTPITGPSGPGAQPAACASGGTLHTAYFSGGNVVTTPYTGTPPAAGSTVTIHADTGNLVAIAATGTTIAVVTAKQNDAARTVNVYLSTNAGATWPTVESFVTGSAGADNPYAISCAFDTSGLLTIIVEGFIRLAATKRTGTNTYAASVFTSDTYTFGSDGGTVAPGIACVYSKVAGTGDFVVAASFFITGNSLYTVALYLFGGGDQQTAGTWSARQTFISTLPYNLGAHTPGSTLAIAGGTLTADSMRFTMLENTRNPTALLNLNTSRNYQVTVQSAAAAKLGAVRDPQALLIDSTTPLVPAYDQSTGRMYWVNGTTVYYADRPSTVDLSSRVLHAVKIERENGGQATVVLDNADGSLTALATSQDTPGDQLTVDFGYTTSAGAEYAASAPLWISSATAISSGGRKSLQLIAHDSWSMLSAWRPRRLYVWLTGQSTISQILGYILARAGIPYVAPGSPSTMLGTSPAFSIKPGENGAIAVHALLDQVPEVLWFTSAGATLRNPLVGDASVYSYTPTSHPPLAARLTMDPRSLNHVLLFGKNTTNPPPPGTPAPTSPTILAEAFDTADTLRIHDIPLLIHDMQVATSNAATRAAVPLRKAQILQDVGEVATAPNAGLELWDVADFTYADLGLSASKYRVRELHTTADFDRDGGVYAQSVGLMNL